MKSGPKVAIVCDWLVGGGAEKVALELHHMFPEAPIYTSYVSSEWRQKLDNKVITGYLQHLGAVRKYIPFLRAWWFSHLNLSQYDLVISSSGAEAKSVKVGNQAKHISYIHAPTHYYWSRYEEYLKSPGFPLGFNWLARLGLKLLVGPLRRWDYKAAQRPNYIIANSNYIRDQIKKYYGREAEVIHPPVDVERFTPNGSEQRQGFVVAGRQTPYKRIDLAVAACTQLNLPLTVLGDGPDHGKLVKMAGPSIKFVADASDSQMADYFRSAQAFIFPAIDDFGIVAVEALAAGTPVIAYKAGGALDYVTESQTGLFFDQPTAESLAKALQSFDPTKFDNQSISQHAERFSAKNFRQKILSLVESKSIE